ncbi:MAG: peptidylprolyl isomerase, partial [Duganella sp.]
IGVGRDNEPDSGHGNELYVVVGQSPRQLDGNVAVVGKVWRGMELLSSLPRGSEAMGFYGPNEAKLPITRVRLAADVPEAERVHLEVLRSEAPIYRDIVEAQRNRGGPWNKYAANYVELCNAPIPVRVRPAP